MPQKTLLRQVLFGRTQRYIWLCLFFVAFSLLNTFFAQPRTADAATSSTLNFQARLLQSSGALVSDGYYNVEFKLYSASSGGTASWTETYYDSNGVTAGNDNRVRVVNGYLTVNLGSLTSFPSNIDWDQDQWLTMNIGGITQTASPTWDGEMSPRLKLTAVPYAFKAGQLAKRTGANTSTLDFATQTGARSILLPDESGTLCIQNSANCGFAASSSVTLQGAYNGGNSILTTDGNNLGITLANTTTDPNFLVNIATGSTGEFKVQNNGTDVLQIGSAGQLQLDTTGSGGGLLIGGDTNLYRSATNVLKTDDTFDAAAFSAGGVSGASTTCSGGQMLQNQVITGGIVTGGSCVSGGASSLQGAYDGGNTILTTDGNNIGITLANTSTDANFNINIATGSTGEFKVQNNGTDVLQIGSAGQLQLDVQGSSGGILFGTDALLYRSAANTLALGTGDDLKLIQGNLEVENSNGESISIVGDDSNATYFRVTNSSAGDWLLASDVTGDSDYRFIIDTDGELQWGDGTDIDTYLYRVDAGALQTSGIFIATGNIYSQGKLTAADDTAEQVEIGALGPGGEAAILFGLASDTVLYRSAADTLMTEDDLIVQSATPSSTAFEVRNDLGNAVLSVDTALNEVSIIGAPGGANPGTVQLYVESNNDTTIRAKKTGTGGQANILELANATDNVLTVSKTGPVLIRTTTDSTTAFKVQTSTGAGSANVITADTQNTRVLIGAATTPSLSTAQLVVTVAEVQTTLRVGNATNGFSFNDTATGASGKLRLYGTARNTKKVILTPEYAGAVLDGSGTGTMTAGYDSTAKKNYYKWTTTQGTNQTYDVVITMAVPSDWSAWATSNPIAVESWTSNTSNATATATVYGTNGTVDSNLNAISITPGSTSTWTTTSGATFAGTYTADGLMTMKISMTAKSSANFELGNITLTYLSAY